MKVSKKALMASVKKKSLLPSVADVEYISAIQAAKIVPGRPHVNTVKRWWSQGYGGVILKSWRLAGKRFTTVAAIDEFLAATSGVEDPNPRRTSSAHKQAEAKLDALGVF